MLTGTALPSNISIIVPNLQTSAALYLTSYLQAFPFVQAQTTPVAEDKVKLSFTRLSKWAAIKHFKWDALIVFGSVFAAGMVMGRNLEKVTGFIGSR